MTHSLTQDPDSDEGISPVFDPESDPDSAVDPEIAIEFESRAKKHRFANPANNHTPPKKPPGRPSIAEISRRYAYDPDSGVISWRGSGPVLVSFPPGTQTLTKLVPRSEYLVRDPAAVVHTGTTFTRADRIAYALMGVEPIPTRPWHKDGDPLNLRWANIGDRKHRAGKRPEITEREGKLATTYKVSVRAPVYGDLYIETYKTQAEAEAMHKHVRTRLDYLLANQSDFPLTFSSKPRLIRAIMSKEPLDEKRIQAHP